MSITVLLEASPRRASDGAVVTLRMVWNARKRADFFNQQWQPVLHLPPSFETDIGFDGTNFGQGALPNIGTMQIALNTVTAAWGALIWKNAALTIKAAAWPRGGLPVDAADGDFALVANAKAASISAADGLLTLVVLDAGEVLRRPVQPVLFGTSGIALLDAADAKDHFGSPVPIGWGVLSKIKGRLVDRTNLIYCFLGRAATGAGGFFDGGAPFTLGVARANLAALIANVPAAGTVDYCLNAAGLVLARPWAKPVYPFTADLTAGSTQAADIANSIVTSRTALTFGAGVVAAFNGIQASPCGRYIDDSSTIAETLDRLFAGLGSFWRLTRTGDLDIKRIGLAGVAAVTFGTWQVAKIERRGTILPTGRRTLGYAHNNTVHGENDIAKLLTANLAYSDGTAIDALKPAALGADVTAAQPVVSQLNTSTGVINDSRALNANNNFGLRSLVDAPSITDSVVSTLCYINIGAFNVYPDWGGSVAYPSGTIGPVSYATTYFVYRNVASAGSTGTSYGYSTVLADALGVGRVYFGYITTRATSGSGGSTGGGTGGGGTTFCVAPDALVETHVGPVPAHLIGIGDVLVTLGDDRASLSGAAVEANVAGDNFTCTIISASGASLTLSVNTPVPSRTGGYVMAANAWMIDVPVLRAGVLTWEPVVEVRALGLEVVQRITCHGAVYAAGDTPDAQILTHNAYQKP